MTKFTILSCCSLLFALAGCGDDPSGGKQKDDDAAENPPDGEQQDEPKDASKPALDASTRSPDASPSSDAAKPDPVDPKDAAKSDPVDPSDAEVPPSPKPDAAADAAKPNDAGKDAGGTSPSGSTTVRETIVVAAGQTYDGQGKRFIAGSELGNGDQSEDQKPVFQLESGAVLRNVVLGSPAADGVHCHGDVKLENIVWEDIGEDALTIKESGTVELRGGSASNGDDKVFQINAASTFRVYDFTARNAGKFIRQNGGTKFKVEVYIEGCDISQMDESIFRTDSEVSTVSMVDTRYSQIGDELFKGVKPANITQKNNVEY